MHTISTELLSQYERYLLAEERSAATRSKYLHDVREFAQWLGEKELTREHAFAWREHLLDNGLAPATVNTAVSALNGLVSFLGREDCRIKFLHVQHKMFRESARELEHAEYERLVCTARAEGKTRLALLLETICGTGIRVSEVRYITVEAAQRRRAEIRMKGKIRTILIPGKLAKKLLHYARKNKIASGEIFLTRSGKGLSRGQIWSEMKALCQKAGVEPEKVFPHNLRHLFARTYYKVSRDVMQLASLLGHSSVETTRIYLMTSGVEQIKVLDRLRLIRE